MIPADDLAPERRPYRPYGTSLDLMFCRDPEVVVSGPAGTGKSRGNLEKIHLVAEKYHGSRQLILRKTRASLTQSGLVTFEEKVVPVGHPILDGASRSHRQSYRYLNGSEIVVGGMDKPTKVMSTDYDVIYVQEAIELTEDEWETLTTRVRHGVVPYQQIIADTNPDRPTHWLKLRADAGRLKMLHSRHEENPIFWDGSAWTPAGEAYLAKLDALTGARKERLRFGRWVQAEGVVYDTWDWAVNLVDRFPIPFAWPRYWSIDFGYNDPFVCQWWALDPDGRLYLYRELYATGGIVEDHARTILREGGLVKESDGKIRPYRGPGEPIPRAIVCDHDAEGRATLEKHLGLKTVAANKAMQTGIQAVKARMAKAGDSKPRLLVLRDSLTRRDPRLVEDKRPTCFTDEIDGYVWDTTSNKNGRRVGEEPVDKDNHSMDAMRYVVAHVDLKPSMIFTRRAMPACGPPGIRI